MVPIIPTWIERFPSSGESQARRPRRGGRAGEGRGTRVWLMFRDNDFYRARPHCVKICFVASKGRPMMLVKEPL